MLLTAIGAEEAAQAFAACAGLDPEGLETPHSAAQAGKSFRLETDHGHLVFTVGPRGGALWCYGAAGTGQGLTDAGLACVERMARDTGFAGVGFQTMRRGLVKRARARGYEVVGAVGRGLMLQKDFDNDSFV